MSAEDFGHRNGGPPSQPEESDGERDLRGYVRTKEGKGRAIEP